MEISSSHVEDRALLLKNLTSFLQKRLPAKEIESLLHFAETYLSFFPLDAWLGREMSDLHGFLFCLRHFLRDAPDSEPRVKVFNPNLDEHGWMCGRTVILVLQKDMPFLVDSIRLEINRRDIPLYVIQSTILQVSRGGDKVSRGGEKASPRDPAEPLIVPGTRGSEEENQFNEALIYLEISLHTEERDLASLRSSLLNVLSDVANVVADYKNLLAELDKVRSALRTHRAADTEVLAFLDWLSSANFTFFGFRSYDYQSDQPKTKSHIDKHLNLVENPAARLGIFKKLGAEVPLSVAIDSNPGIEAFHLGDELICFSKSSTRSNVHRGVYPDYIVIKKFDAQGKVCGEVRFLGLFTYPVFSMSPLAIPLLRKKLEKIIVRTGLDTRGYYGKNLLRVIENFPKEELFQSDEETLFKHISNVASINERHLVRLIMRKDRFGRFVYCMVFVPREVYSTKVRLKIQRILGQALQTDDCDSTTWFSESTLARAQFVFRIDPASEFNIDVAALEQVILDITKTWDEHLRAALIDTHGEARGISYFNYYREAFSQAYQESFDARSAVGDIEMLERLKNDNDIAMNLYQPIGAAQDSMRFKVMHLNAALELSVVVPILENLGLRVLGEHPFKITLPDGQEIWLHDFTLAFGLPVQVDVHAVRAHFEEAFANVWRGRAESDPFNRLVLGARLNWREVALLRVYAGYLKQIGFNSSERFVADTLVNHLEITRNLVALFKASFDPRLIYKAEKADKTEKAEDSEAGRVERLKSKILASLDEVSNLNEDRVLRRYLDLINATLRTNYFQKNTLPSVNAADEKDYIAIKFSPRDIPDMPEPRPLFEIYVYSPSVEGVHLRAARVARGGLRWSDRLQDYRTEVLGLVKAQQVKNAVIVPSGAKGGFVAKKLDKSTSRAEYLAEGIACYKTFIRGLLDLTDNLVEGKIVAPEGVIRKDADDPYLVVAADKGTASFSDIANAIAKEYGFWLGDAFASGGSQGYDHKGMGITARGGWISVQRHFREKGVDIQNQDFTVLGIGDMAGDVFGNGMLRSPHICLVAAFNHAHIFIDPTPDPAASFAERKRLFETPGSTWEDYNPALISRGGGVFPRSAKAIKISPEMKKVLLLSADKQGDKQGDKLGDKLAPADLINALLKAPVDLIWNGGIGTYVKASWEPHSAAGDKANDALRVNGKELRCKVFGEGGNLGMTQLGRVEYALNGGACNTDFIDNAGGVDCSDHEVNIKILLDELVANGDLTGKQRNKLLADMTDEVAGLVLQNNYRQTLSISLAEHDVVQRITEYRRFINFMEANGRLNRALEFLPTDEEIVERQGQGKGLTRPELAVLISYAKVMLKEELSASTIAEDAYILQEMATAFPPKLRKKYPQEIYRHRLQREIVATQVANDLINNLGITAGHRLIETTGAPLGDIARAYIVSRDVFQFEKFQAYIKSLDNLVPADFQMELMKNMIRRVRRGTRWFLRNRRAGLCPAEDVAMFKDGIQKVQKITQDLVGGSAREELSVRIDYLKNHQVEAEWLLPLSMPGNLFSGLSVVQAAIEAGQELVDVTTIFIYLLDTLNLNWFASQISNVHVETYWQALARETYIDDLEAQVRKLTVNLLRLRGERDISEVYPLWLAHSAFQINRWRTMVNEVQSTQLTDYAMFAVAMRELIDLAQNTAHCNQL